MPEIPVANPEDILTQLITGPSLREVASHTLRTQLDTLYPTLAIDPTQAMVVTPTWDIVDGQVTPGHSRFESLTDALVRLTLTAKAATYIDGEHYLTLQPGIDPAIQLPVRIDAIGRLINQLIPLLFVAYQEQQLDYWNQPTDTARHAGISSRTHCAPFGMPSKFQTGMKTNKPWRLPYSTAPSRAFDNKATNTRPRPAWWISMSRANIFGSWTWRC